jgi:CHASE1-domain containing sensor protein
MHWKRYLPVLLAIGIGLSFSLAAFFTIRLWESRNIEKTFQMDAEERAYTVKNTFETEVAMIDIIRSALYEDGKVERNEFENATAPFLARTHSIRSVEWIPRVPNAKRREFEAAARRDGFPGYQITELDRLGCIVPASERNDYYPIFYTGPHETNPVVWGFDINSEPIRREAVQQARDTGKIIASGRITFVENTIDNDGFLAILPVYERDRPLITVEQRREAFAGMMLGIFKPGDMLDAALAKVPPSGIDVYVYDPTNRNRRVPFRFHASRARREPWSSKEFDSLTDPNRLHCTVRFDVAGHPWTVACVATPDFVAMQKTWSPWGVLIAGMVFTGLAAIYISASIDRRAYIEQLFLEKRTYAMRLEEKVREQTSEIRHAEEEVIYRLASASQWRDEETGMHIRRTGLLSEYLAKAAGWSQHDAELLRLAAPMHDVGKIGIPDAILRKPGKLTSEEFDVMKTHTLIGAEILADSKVPLIQMARQIALNHHERWDGLGYPHGISGPNIPESARILSIVDVYDALSHDRVYRPAMPEEEVMKIMRQGAGMQFDPLLLTHFFLHLTEIRRIAQQLPDEPLHVLEPIVAPTQTAAAPVEASAMNV